jgi:hypothetical protein
MFVAIVIAPGVRLRDDLRFARVLLRVEHLVRQLLLDEVPDSISEFSIDVVPTSTGCRARGNP